MDSRKARERRSRIADPQDPMAEAKKAVERARIEGGCDCSKQPLIWSVKVRPYSGQPLRTIKRTRHFDLLAKGLKWSEGPGHGSPATLIYEEPPLPGYNDPDAAVRTMEAPFELVSVEKKSRGGTEHWCGPSALKILDDSHGVWRSMQDDRSTPEICCRRCRKVKRARRKKKGKKAP